jgi:hypothetical protein
VKKPTAANTTVRSAAKMATTRYSSLRNAKAPSRTAVWISRMRSVPALWRRMLAARTPAKASATTPAAGAR